VEIERSERDEQAERPSDGRGGAGDRFLAALDRLSLAALESRGLDELLPRLLRVIVETSTSVHTAEILLLEGDRLVVRAAVGLEEAQGSAVRVGDGFEGRIAAERRPLALGDAAHDPLVVSDVIRARGVRALYGVPLVADGALLGVAHVGSLVEAVIPEPDRALFVALAERATSGLRLHLLREESERRGLELQRAVAERTRLEAELYGRFTQLSALAELGMRALRIPLGALLDVSAAGVGETLGAELVMITQRTSDGAGLQAIAGVGWQEGIVGHEILDARLRSQAGFTIVSREPVISDDYPGEARFVPVPFIVAHGARSSLSAVIEASGGAGAPFGVIAAFSKRGAAFSRDDAAFLQSVANVVAAAVEKDRSEARVRDDLTFLADASHALSASLDVEATAERVARITAPRLADWCVVDVRTAAGWREVVWHADPAKRAEGRERHARGATGAPNGTFLSIPLVARGRRVGAVTLITEGERRIGVDELQLAEELARHAELAIDNAGLYAESQRAVRDRDEVIGIVSHDLRSPLNGITLAAAALDARLGETQPAARRQVSVIRRSAARMDRLIRDLLDMARIRAGKLVVTPVETDAADLLDETIHLEALAAEEKGIQLVRAGAAGPLSAPLDRDRVQQVLTNLLGNALKFTPAGGTVTASIVGIPGVVRFEVADTGPGVAPENAARVFEAYWTRGETRASGAGLGLFISRGIVEAHGGRMGLTSTPGAGATFWFELPAVTPPRPTP
jgi:signal transduction histidine kinase